MNRTHVTVRFDHQIFALQARGGISRYVIELDRMFKGLPEVESRIMARIHRNRHLAEYTSKRIPRASLWMLERLPRCAHAIDAILAAMEIGHIHADILHETYYTRTPIPIPRHARRILTVYDMAHEIHPSLFQGDPTPSRKIVSCQRADHIITISETTKADLIRIASVDPTRITAIPLGVAPTFSPSPEFTPQDVTFRPLLYVGERTPHKGFDTILRAIAKMPAPERPDLVCFGGGELSQAELRRLEQLGIAPESIRQTTGDDSVLLSCYRSARALIAPSLYEGFGLPVLEAMACGCPVICSRIPVFMEVAGTCPLFFEPRSEDDLLAQIAFLSRDLPFRQKMTDRGLLHASGFTWENTARATLDAYRNTLLLTSTASSRTKPAA